MKQTNKWVHPVRFLMAGFIVFIGLVTLIGSGGGGGGDGGEENIGWITIQSSNVNVDAGGTAIAALSGEAFVSSDYVAHQCIGLACLFDWYDDSYPGVDITWMNLTAGTQGTASSRYGTATDWDHLWSANVPVIGGLNQLRISAADPAGNTVTANVSVEYIPPAPSDLHANTGDGEITLLWSPVPEATAYRLYWATTPGVAFSLGTPIDLTGSPYVHSGLANGTTYYYAITSRYLTSESPPSAEIAANAGAPSQPTNLTATLMGSDVQLAWDTVVTAGSYTLYWANEPGVTKQTGTPISGVISPYLHTSLSGLPYYYIVTAENGYGESLESAEVMASPPLAPPAPTGLSTSLRSGGTAVDLTWQPVLGAYDYDVYRCWAWAISTAGGCEPAPNSCYGSWEHIGQNITATYMVDWTVDTVAYWYYVTSRNAYGSSVPSDWDGLCIAP